VTVRIMSIKISKNISDHRTRDVRLVQECLNQLRHRVPLIVNSVYQDLFTPVLQQVRTIIKISAFYIQCDELLPVELLTIS
jgi:hypothetical protein